MPNKYRWSDDFSSDPFADPAYSITPGANGWVYNASTDLLENTAGASSMVGTATLLDSAHPVGIVEADLFTTFSNNSTFLSLHAFGYWLVVGQYGTTPLIIALPDNFTPADIHSSGAYFTFGPYVKTSTLTGLLLTKVVSTPLSVDWYINGILQFSLPQRVSSNNVEVQLFKGGATGGGTYRISSLSVKSDSSLPQAITITTPGIGGALPATTGPVVLEIPDSRLYLDLTAYAGSIGTDGLSSVFYDPTGANVAMTEDTGVSDGLGGTLGDYYLETPVRGVSTGHRLSIKEAFVTANSVVVTDTIRISIAGGPTNQDLLVTEEDDLQCHIEKHSTPYNSREVFSPIINSTNITIHNGNADGNDGFIIENGPRTRMISSQINASQINGTGRLRFSSSHTYPILFDFDLGRVRHISKIALVHIDTNLTVRNLQSFDLYTKLTPFAGASLAQGTLEYDNYTPISFQTSVSIPYGIDLDYYLAVKGFSDPEISLKTRYLRLAINLDNTYGTGASDTIVGRQFLFFEKTELGSINSFDDNAQFEFDPGSGFVAFPVGGVAQGSGYVRITLPSSIEHDGSSPNYYKVFFKPDITD